MLRRIIIIVIILVLIVAVYFLIIGQNKQATSNNESQTQEKQTNVSATDPVLVGTGDITSCSSTHDEETAKLIENIPGTVFTAGDNAYPNGSTEDFNNCYSPSWGQFKDRTMPALGNHDYNTKGAAAYFAYFGASADDPAKGYYSYDLGQWHIIVINSNCSEIGGCQAGSLQLQWLQSDLASHQTDCTLAYMHHPLFNTGFHGNTDELKTIWQTLYDAGADVVVAGHDHNYQRFSPLDPNGKKDLNRGIREFVVGTGGGSLYEFFKPATNIEARNDDTYGVLKLTLHPTSYDWEFIPVAGKTFTDSGTDNCH